jgi:hypothetical protein
MEKMRQVSWYSYLDAQRYIDHWTRLKKEVWHEQIAWQ